MKINWINITGITITILILLLISIYSTNIGVALVILTLISLILFVLKKKRNFYLIIVLTTILLMASYDYGSSNYIVIGILFFLHIIYKSLKANKINEIVFSKKYFLFFLCSLIIICTQVLVLPRFTSTYEHLIVLLFGFIIILLQTGIIKSEKQLNFVYLLWGICVITTIIIGLWEIQTGNNLRFHTASPEKNVAAVGFYNRNNFSFYLGVSLPVFFYLFQKSFLYKAISICSILCIFYIVYINETRSILLLILLSIFAFTFKLIINRKSLLFIVTVTLIFIVFILNIDIIFDTINNILTLNDEVESSSKRTQLSLEGIEIAKESYFLGVGPGNSEHYMLNVGEKLHNFWLELLVNYGFLIFIGFTYFYFSSIYLFIKKTPEHLKMHIWPVLWSAILFVPASFTPSSIFNFFFLWFLLGLIISVRFIVEKENKSMSQLKN